MEAESEKKPGLEPDFIGRDSSQGKLQTKKYSISPTTVLLAPVVAVMAGLGILGWMCLYTPGIAFLPPRSGTEWIVYPSPPVAIAQRFIPLMATFRRPFKLDTLPPKAVLTVCAFKNFAVTVNGQPAQVIHPVENWKSASTLDITRNLHMGANEIMVSVTNPQGPPALWLQIHGGPLSFGTEKDWIVSQAGCPLQKAEPATQPPEITQGNPFYEQETKLSQIKRVWLLLAFCALSTISVFTMESWLRNHSGIDRNKLVNALLVLVIIARVALFVNDTPQLPRFAGFDAADHQEYVQFILENHALPSGAEGRETYQPPLYYVCAAGLLDSLGLSTVDSDATFVLRSINGVVGVIQCVLSLLCLRLLFPRNNGTQAAGLLLAAFIPPQLYLSGNVTNELLSGLLATSALYFLLKIIRMENEKTLLYLGLGASLGAALLTKSSSLPLLPFIVVVLGLRFHWRSRPAQDWLWYSSVFLFPCLAVCGLFYGRDLWGYVVVAPPFWQYPGFRTIAYYCRFGHVFTAPLSGGVWSFWDGLYSTLWGDGYASGAGAPIYRPPWNYSLMHGGYMLSAVISIIFVIGFVVAIFAFLRRRALEWVIMPGILILFGLAILYMTLRAPFYSETKAFFCLPAFFPFIAVTSLGWDWLGTQHRVLRNTLWVALLVWTTTIFASFWIRHGNPQTYLTHGLAQAEAHNDDEGSQSFSIAAQLEEVPGHSRIDPQFIQIDSEARFYLGQHCESDGNIAGALENYEKAVSANKDYPEALNNLAWMLATSSDPAIRNGSRAVDLAKHACEITQYQQAVLIGTLAAAYAEAGRFDDATAAAGMAITNAQWLQETNLVQKNQQLLQLYLAHRPYHESNN